MRSIWSQSQVQGFAVVCAGFLTGNSCLNQLGGLNSYLITSHIATDCHGGDPDGKAIGIRQLGIQRRIMVTGCGMIYQDY